MPEQEAELRRAVEAASAELDRMLLAALEPDDPVPFLLTLSQLYAMVRGESTGKPDSASVRAIVEPWAAADRQQFQAAAYGLAVLVGTDDDRATARRILGSAFDDLPEWLQSLPDVQPTEVWVGLDEVHATATVAIGLQLATGRQLTMLSSLDQDQLSCLVGLDVVATTPGAAAERWKADNVGGEIFDVAAADAAARVRHGVTWACLGPADVPDGPRQLRTFIEWVLAKLPTDGRPLPEQEVSDLEQFRELRNFLETLPKDQQDDPDVESIALSCLQERGLFADPLRWSAGAVGDFLSRTVLVRWLPLGRAYLIKYPDVLAALIAYGHGVRGIRQERTDETLAALEQLQPRFVSRLDELCGAADHPAALTGRRLLSLLDAESPADVDWSRLDWEEYANAG